MSEKKRSASGRRSPAAVMIISAALICAIALYIAGGIGTRRGTESLSEDIVSTRGRLEAMSAKAPIDFQEEAKRRYKEMMAERGGILVDDMDAEKQKILELSGSDKAELLRWFSDAAIVGDSITKGATGYGWLDTSIVFAKIGVRVAGGADIIKKAVMKQPSVIFFAFGLNDIETYVEKVDLFIEDYTKYITAVQELLPDTAIYINALFPPKSTVHKKFYNYLDLYNEKLEEMCSELGVYYVDSGFILREMPSLYDADGVHPKPDFYPRWFTYLADIAGLSKDDE